MNKEEYREEKNGHNIEERLEELLQLGWIMLPESCSSPSCNCPLMQSPNKQKYCVGCEAWHFDARRQKYGELVPKGVTDLLLKETDLQKKMPNRAFDFVLNQSVIRCLQTKLYFLATLLNNESDLSKIKDILETMKICFENIKMALNLEYEGNMQYSEK